MLTRALAKALAPEITVNSVAPGVIPFGGTDARIEAMIRDTPAQRAGTADDIADAGNLLFEGDELRDGPIASSGRRTNPTIASTDIYCPLLP
jgi:NAD(P)-dependent dehydrogenase (short-subunit alcohol dehydrogenase family)